VLDYKKNKNNSPMEPPCVHCWVMYVGVHCPHARADCVCVERDWRL
jgi:hypothetical protein